MILIVGLLAGLSFGQTLTFGIKLGGPKKLFLSYLKSKNIEYVESGNLVMVEEFKLGDLTMTADFEFDDAGNLIMIESQSGEVTSSKDIPKAFRAVNSKLQDEFGLPQNREKFDLTNVPETELYVMREWNENGIKVELGILHMEDIYAIAIKMKKQ
jgi:hypothetical protein